MPKDSSGRPHTGTFGLFDDVDEVPRPRAAHIDAIEMQGVPRQHRWYHGNKEARMSRQAGLRQVDPQEVAEARTSRLLSMVFVGGKDDRLPGGNDDMKEEGAPEKERRVQSMVGVPDVRVVGVEEEPGAFKSHTRNVASSLGGDLMSHRRNVPGRAGDLANQTRSVVVGGSGGQMHSGSIAGPGRHMHSGSVAGVGRHMHSGSIAGVGRHMHSGSVAGVGGHARTGSVVVGGGHSHMRSVVGRSGLAYNQTGSVYGHGNTRSVVGGGVGSVYGGRGPIGPDYVYREGEVEVLDSPWLKECGMVRVKSSLPGGCEIVPKNMLTRGD